MPKRRQVLTVALLVTCTLLGLTIKSYVEIKRQQGVPTSNEGCAPCQDDVIALKKNTNSPSKRSLVGEYSWNVWYMGETLRLKSDGRFQKITRSDAVDPVTGESGREIYGDYGIRNGVVILCPEYSIPGGGVTPKYANKRTKEPDCAVSLLPVQWGDRLYLLSQNKQEVDFCNAVNSGAEPRAAHKLRNESFFYLRSGDEKKPVRGLPPIPPCNNHAPT
jgi:hypothetical protein